MKQIEKKHIARELWIHTGALTGLKESISAICKEIHSGGGRYAIKMLERLQECLAREENNARQLADAIAESEEP